MKITSAPVLLKHLRKLENKLLKPHYIIGLDVGESKVGCAVTVDNNRLALAQGTWVRSPDNTSLIQKYQDLVSLLFLHLANDNSYLFDIVVIRESWILVNFRFTNKRVMGMYVLVS